MLSHFVETVKVLKVRQENLKKAQLKPKEVRAALHLIAYHYERTKEINVRLGKLDEMLGREPTEKDALDYFEKNLLGTLKDKGGREILIDLDGIKYLYKDPEHGAHVVKADHFLPIRAKRMPWIRWTIENSTEVYFQEVQRARGEVPWRFFGYVHSFLVPSYRDRETGKEGMHRNYLFVVVRRKRKDSPMEFVTAYHFDDHETLLKRVAAFEPFTLPGTT